MSILLSKIKSTVVPSTEHKGPVCVEGLGEVSLGWGEDQR